MAAAERGPTEAWRLGYEKGKKCGGGDGAGGAQSISVEASGHDTTIAKGESRRSVPGFVETLVILVKGPNFRGEGFFRAIGGGDQHEHRVQGAAARDG